MKSWHKRLLSLILALSMLLSCFTVLVFADDESGEETEGNTEPVVVYNRDFQDGWGVFNGLGNEKAQMKKHNFFIDKEVTSDYSYNYFARFELADTIALGQAANATDGFAQLGFESLNYPHSKHVFIEFDIKIDDLCNIGNILYMRTEGGNGVGSNIQLLNINNERLFVLPSYYKSQEGIEMGSEWLNIVIDFDYTTPDKDPLSHFELTITVNDTETFTASVDTSEGHAGLDIFRFGVPPVGNAEASAERAGQSFCLDNLQAYINADARLTDAELDAAGYGTLVDVNQIKTVVIDGNSQGMTKEEILNGALCFKVGVDYALNKGKQIDLTATENCGAPVLHEGKVMVPFQALLNYLGSGVEYADGKTYAISIGIGVAYVTIGRTLATVNGEVIELSTAPGFYTDPETGNKYPVVALDDIEKIFPGYYVTYDDMGLIVFCQVDNILSRENELSAMLDLMNRFIYNFIDEDEVYERAKELTNDFTHPYLFGGQEVYDKLIAIYLGEDTTDYGIDLKEGITYQVQRAYHFYAHFAKPAGLSAALDEETGEQIYIKDTVVDREGARNFPAYYDENGELAATALDAPYGGLNPYKSDLETLNFPHLATNGYDPGGGRQAESGTVTGWAYDIAFGYIITGDIRLAQLAYDILVAVGEWDHWCPGHFLNCADAAQKYAMAMDWIYQGVLSLENGAYDDELGTNVGKLPSKYYEAGYLEELLYKNGLRMGYLVSSGQHHGHIRPQGDVCYYTTMANNWNAVCTAGMWLAALSLMGSEEMGQLGTGEGEQPYSKTAAWLVANNLQTLALYGMTQYAPDGSYVESPGYWGYGTNSMYLGLMSLWRCLGDDFGYLDAPGMDKTCYFACQVESSEFNTFSYHDGGVQQMDTSSFFFVAEASDDPVLREIRLLHLKNGKDISIRDLLYFPYETSNSGAKVELPLDYYMEGIDAFVTRSSWEKGALYAGIIGGMNSASHGQVDSGSFVYHNDGKIWITDIGSDTYNIYGYFNGQNGAPANTRYRYYRMNAEGHNTVAITSQPLTLPYGQKLSAGGDITDWFSNEFGSYAIIDQTDVYGGYANFARRGMMLTNDRKTLVIQDEIALDGVQTMYWFAHFDITNITYEIAANGRTMYLYWMKNNQIVQTLRLTIVSRNAYEKFTVTTAGETEEDRLLKGDNGTVDYAFSKANGAAESEKPRNLLRRIAIKAHTNTMQMAVCIELIDSVSDPVGYSTLVPMDSWVPQQGITEDTTDKTNLRGAANIKNIKSEVKEINQLIENKRHLTSRLLLFYYDLCDIYYISINFFPEDLRDYAKELADYDTAKAIYDAYITTINRTANATRGISQMLISG